MPVFHYKGYKQDGAPVAGTIEAEGIRDAAAMIRRLGIFPKKVDEHARSERRLLSLEKRGDLLPSATRQLSILLVSGVPLMEALRTLSDEHRGQWKSILIAVRERVAAGASLSRALEEQKGLFPEFYLSMVAAGEQSGALDTVLARLADFLEKQAAITAKVRTALIYPAFMTIIGFAVLSFLFTFVIPKVVKMFEHSKSALPFITTVLIAISNFFVQYWWLIAGALLGGMALLRKLHRERRDIVDALKLAAPGDLLQSLYCMRFARTLGFLLEGGTSMLKALDLAARSIGNTVLEYRVQKAVARVAEGARLSAALDGFPPVLLQLIATGERGGRMAEVLNKAADSYEDAFNRSVQRALSFLEPALIVLMGAVVCFIVLAVLLPMLQLNQLVK